jgi:Winged helix-turn helix
VIRHALEIAATPPQKRTEVPLPRWTLKHLVVWVKEKFQIDCCRDTVLKRLGFSWKKARKLLNKANTAKRSEYLEILKGLMQDVLDNDHLLVFIDEAHIHLDTDEGFGWSVKGERFWVSSCSPGLAKVSFYGVYIYKLGQVRLFPYDVANGLNTIRPPAKVKESCKIDINSAN